MKVRNAFFVSSLVLVFSLSSSFAKSVHKIIVNNNEVIDLEVGETCLPLNFSDFKFPVVQLTGKMTARGNYHLDFNVRNTKDLPKVNATYLKKEHSIRVNHHQLFRLAEAFNRDLIDLDYDPYFIYKSPLDTILFRKANLEFSRAFFASSQKTQISANQISFDRTVMIQPGSTILQPNSDLNENSVLRKIEWTNQPYEYAEENNGFQTSLSVIGGGIVDKAASTVNFDTSEVKLEIWNVKNFELCVNRSQ